MMVSKKTFRTYKCPCKCLMPISKSDPLRTVSGSCTDLKMNHAGPFGEHTRIAGHSLASTTSAAQNFHTNVIFNAEFNGGVQICNSLCAYIIKI